MRDAGAEGKEPKGRRLQLELVIAGRWCSAIWRLGRTLIAIAVDKHG